AHVSGGNAGGAVAACAIEATATRASQSPQSVSGYGVLGSRPDDRCLRTRAYKSYFSRFSNHLASHRKRRDREQPIWRRYFQNHRAKERDGTALRAAFLCAG